MSKKCNKCFYRGQCFCKGSCEYYTPLDDDVKFDSATDNLKRHRFHDEWNQYISQNDRDDSKKEYNHSQGKVIA